MSYCLNPYSGTTLISFLKTFCLRFFGMITGQIPLSAIVSDEIQCMVLMNISISCALLGSFLLLRKTTMLANALSHTVLLGIILSVVFFSESVAEFSAILPIKVLLMSAMLSAVLTIALTEFFMHGLNVQEDASIGIVFTTLFALGVILATLYTRNAHIGTEAVMGDVDALHIMDLGTVALLALFNILITYLFYKEYEVTTFDPGFAKSIGIQPRLYHYLLMVQTSLTIVFAFRAVGVVMVLGFITIPATMARLTTDSLKKMIGIAVLYGVLGSLLGVALSRHLLSTQGMALSTSGVTVVTLGLLLFALMCLKPLWGFLVNLLRSLNQNGQETGS